MWTARTKRDLIIEVWEKLDCESVGGAELEAIEVAVREQFGPQAVDSPMRVARTLADEGADLRHSEIMELYLARAEHRPYEAALRNILDAADLSDASRSLRDLENLRRKYTAIGDKDGLRAVREHALSAKANAVETASREQVDSHLRLLHDEIARWITVWLQTPDAFDSWVKLRQRSPEFREIFEVQDA